MERMSFWDHLEELRKRIIYALIGVGFFSILGYILSGKILDILAKPVKNLYFFSPVEAFYVRIKIAFIVGIFVGLPWVLYQLWLFIVPGLKVEEKKYGVWGITSSFLLFILGGIFGYMVVIPAGLRILLSFGTSRVKHILNLSLYFNFILWTLLVCGMLFLLPVVIFFLTKLKIINYKFLKNKRRYAIVGIVIGAAFLTPSVDAFTLVLVTLPLILLYELSIFVSYLAGK